MVYFIIVPFCQNDISIYHKNLSKILENKDSKNYHIFYLKKNKFIYDNKLFDNFNFLNVINKIIDFHNYDKIIFHSTKYILNNNLESVYDVTYTFNCKNDKLINLDIFLEHNELVPIEEKRIDSLFNYSFLVIIKTKCLKLVSLKYRFNSIDMMIFYIIKYLNKIGCSFNFLPYPIYRISNFKPFNLDEGKIKSLEFNYLNNIRNYKIIYFSLMGKKGRLGNQLFQYAFLYKIHNTTKREIYLPQDINLIPEYSLNYFPKIKYYTLKNKVILKTLNETDFSYDKTLLDDIHKNNNNILNINGFYQSPFYFNDIRDDILDMFTFKVTLFDKAKKWYKKLGNDLVISMHIRRGDYVKFKDYHFILPDVYYYNCINYLEQKFNKFTILVFSENNYFITDLILMTLCDHNIIANSSFSWWGAYLNKKDNLILCPNKWFGKIKKKNHDLYLDNWIIIDIN